MTYIEPALPLCLLLAAVGVAIAWRRSPRGRKPWLAVCGLGATVLASLDPAAWLFSRPLEIWYPGDGIPRGPADAIVVFSGAVGQPLPATSARIVGRDTYIRLQWAVWLYKNWKPLPILVSGGNSDGEPNAVTMRRLLESEGIPPDRIWVETQSLNTHENAVYSARILSERGIQRIALVVEAVGMPRAAACFRRQGVQVVPAPAAFHDIDWSVTGAIPNWRAIATNGETLHEVVGFVWYWFRGWV